MRRAEGTPETAHPEPERGGLGAVGGQILSLLCLGGILVLGFQQWRELRRRERFLEVPLLAGEVADYSVSKTTRGAAPVGLGIVADMIRDSQPEAEALVSRLQGIQGTLLAPLAAAPPVIPPPVRRGGGEETGRAAEDSGQGRPGPDQKPDKPDHPGKPERPDKPVSPDKPERPEKPEKPSGGGKAGGKRG